MNSKVHKFFDRDAEKRDHWVHVNYYYNRQIINFLRFHIPKNSNILEIGCATGHLLNALNPKKGVGIDFSKNMVEIASQKYPHLEFINADASNYKLKETFDYIIISDTIGYFDDIQEIFKNIRQNCSLKTRIIITSYNHLWEPLLKLLEKLNLKMNQPFTSWLSDKDIISLLELEGFSTIKSGKKILLPKYLLFFSRLFNKYLITLPLFRKMGLVNYVIARPLNLEKRKEKTVSILVPARNEKGNIEKIVQALPDLGKKTEILFVEGGSRDRTWEEIQRVAKKYKHKDITFIKQDGKGKGNAVRNGFEIAKGDILMIYDADMTVPAKDLVKFYEAIVGNKGEFINGTRLVYPMEKQAMRTLNLFGNKMFSLAFSWILDQRIKDTLCGTKVLSKESYLAIQKNRLYFGDFDPFGDFDLIFGASKLNLKFAEIPIRYQERTYGDTNIQRFSHGWLLIKMCIFAMKKIKFI